MKANFGNKIFMFPLQVQEKANFGNKIFMFPLQVQEKANFGNKIFMFPLQVQEKEKSRIFHSLIFSIKLKKKFK